MTAAPSRRRDRRPPAGLVFFLLLAIGFGVLAALLASPLPSGPSAGTTGAGPALGSGLVLFQLSAYLALGLVATYFGVEVYRRVRDGRIPVPWLYTLTVVIVLLLGVLFVGLFHLLSGGGGAAPGNATGPSRNSSGSNGGPTDFNSSLNSSRLPIGGGIPGPLASLAHVPWADVGIALLVGLAAVLVYLLYAPAPPPEPSDGAAEEEARRARLRGELRAALDALADDPAADPREAIRALYHRWLLAIGPRLGETRPRTPRELSADVGAALGLPPGPVELLTALFEEARYSTHPMTAEDSRRARRALRELLAAIPGGPARPAAAGPEPPR